VLSVSPHESVWKNEQAFQGHVWRVSLPERQAFFEEWKVLASF